MKQPQERERREHPRFPQVLDVHARSLSSVHSTPMPEKEFDGRVQNLSAGGVCILSSLPLPASSFVRCDIAMPDIPVAIPTLMQVRWTAKRGHKTLNYLSGLRFITS